MTEPTPKKTGWANPNVLNSRIFHYFGENGQSLCGKWMVFHQDFEDTQDSHSQNCKACARKVLAYRKNKPTL